MPTINHNIMLAVDWLSLSLLSMEPLTHERLVVDVSQKSDELRYKKTLCFPADLGKWDWRPRKYGTKQFRTIWEVSYIDEDGAAEPFGILCSEPTTANNDPCLCTLKLDNHLLYRDSKTLWVDLLRCFLADYQLRILNISRCDLAADFLYLRGRVSGAQLVENLKSFRWWKCGSVKVSEHYKMPYQIDGAAWDDSEKSRPKLFLQQGKIAARVETLTFGTMSSDAQVCIYDKTLELRRSEVTIGDGDNAHTESAKEYIRDCHKESGVYDKKRHTWRIEIRLKSKALFLMDHLRNQERPLELTDLEPLHLFETFRAAAAKYFRLVDASCGGTQEITPAYCNKMASHKNRLQEVELFNSRNCRVSFTKKKYHEAANKFHRSVIKRLDELGDRIKRVPCHYTKPEDKTLLPSLIERLEPIADKMAENRSRLQKAVAALTDVETLLRSTSGDVSEKDAQLIDQAKEMLERHVHTESPQFCRNIIIMLNKYSNRMLHIDKDGSAKGLKLVRSAHPEDSQILLEAAEILKAVYVDAVYDDRKDREQSILEQSFRDAIGVISVSEEPPPQILDYAYMVCETNYYLPEDKVARIISDYRKSDFYQLLRCNWSMETWHNLLHHRGTLDCWRPPMLRAYELRNFTERLALGKIHLQ